MVDYIKKYYLYIIVGIVVTISLVLSIDFEKTPEISVPIQVIEQEVNKTFIYIDIRGSVLNPGVYKVESGTRLFQLVTIAGGYTDEVNDSVINQSVLLEDEMFIYIPNVHDKEVEIITGNNSNNSKLVNINEASKSELEGLPGVGPSTAQSIIDYRENVDAYIDIEDIMNVPGIGESTFNEIKSLITV